MSTPELTQEQRFRRAAGRKKYNRGRQALAHWRQLNLQFSLKRMGYELPDGWIEAKAQEYGVSIATIYRDLQAIDFRKMRQMYRDSRARFIEKYIARYGYPDDSELST